MRTNREVEKMYESMNDPLQTRRGSDVDRYSHKASKLKQSVTIFSRATAAPFRVTEVSDALLFEIC